MQMSSYRSSRIFIAVMAGLIVILGFYGANSEGLEIGTPSPEKLCKNTVQSQVMAAHNGSGGYVQIPSPCIKAESLEWADDADSSDLAGYFPNSSNEYRLKKVE